MDKHKNKALEDDCLCTQCKYRFQCFTQERVFSDPLYQGLFEALMAKGRSREEAIEEVANELKLSIGGGFKFTGDIVVGETSYPWKYYYPESGNTFSVDGDQITYTMSTGEEVSWYAGTDGIGDIRIHLQ